MSSPSSPAFSRARVCASFASRCSAAMTTVGDDLARHDDDAVGIADDHISRDDRRAGADDGNVDAAGTVFGRPLRRHRLRPDWKTQSGDLDSVAHTGVDDQAGHALRAARFGQQLAEHAVGGFGEVATTSTSPGCATASAA